MLTSEMIRGRRRVLMRSLIILLSLLIISATVTETEPITSSRREPGQQAYIYSLPSLNFHLLPLSPLRDIAVSRLLSNVRGRNDGSRFTHKRCKEMPTKTMPLKQARLHFARDCSDKSSPKAHTRS